MLVSMFCKYSSLEDIRVHHTLMSKQTISPTSMDRTIPEIVAFLLTNSGWVLVSSTLVTEYWKVYSLAGTIILTTAAFYSNLWKICVTDSTGVSDCKDFPSMLALDGKAFIPSTQWRIGFSTFDCVCSLAFLDNFSQSSQM